MRCKVHPYESGVGVCAACLRHRLLALAAAQNEATAPLPPPAPLPLPSSPPPPLLPFPRSVSPYVARRKSDASSSSSAAACRRRHRPGLLFFRTPQVGPSANSGFVSEEGMIGGAAAGSFERRRSGKFSVLATLFGQYSKSEHRVHDGDKQIPYKSKSKYSSWLSGMIFPRGRRRQSKQGPDPMTCGPGPRPGAFRVSNRGMSPEAEQEDDVEEEDDVDCSAAESPWRPTPTVPSPMRKVETSRRRHHGGGGGGLAFCLSPLVRPSPRPHLSVEVGFSGEIGSTRSPHHRHFAGGGEASLRHSRSRKLADVGRFR